MIDVCAMIEGSNLLAALRTGDQALIEPYLVECAFAAGRTLCEPGDSVRHAYFPRFGALAGFMVTLDGAHAVETMMVGREGALGGVVSQGSVPAYARLSVIQAGGFYRIALTDLEMLKDRSPAIRHLLSRYSDCMVAQMFQSIGCNAVHSIEQRAAKWLLATIDRTGDSRLNMTQEELATMMGIGRSYASRVLQRFKADALLKTRRGGIEVTDRQRLGERACTCNDLVRRHFDTLLRGVYPQ